MKAHLQPILLFSLNVFYHSGYYTLDHFVGFVKLSGWISLMYVGILVVRGKCYFVLWFHVAFRLQYLYFVE